MQAFYKYAPLVLALFRMPIGLAGYYPDVVLQLSPERLLQKNLVIAQADFSW